MPTPVDVATWVDVLREGGGWALSVLFAVVIVYLYRENKAKDERIYTLLDKQNDVLRAIGDLSRVLPALPGRQ